MKATWRKMSSSRLNVSLEIDSPAGSDDMMTTPRIFKPVETGAKRMLSSSMKLVLTLFLKTMHFLFFIPQAKSPLSMSTSTTSLHSSALSRGIMVC